MRYFVDDRGGCVAVRDSENTDSSYQGLHDDTRGVVRFWMKKQIEKICPTCHHSTTEWPGNGGPEAEEAEKVAAELNANDPQDWQI